MISVFKLKINGFKMKKISPVQNYMSFLLLQMKNRILFQLKLFRINLK